MAGSFRVHSLAEIVSYSKKEETLCSLLTVMKILPITLWPGDGISGSQLIRYVSARRNVLQGTRECCGLTQAVLQCRDYQNCGAVEWVSSAASFSPTRSATLVNAFPNR